MRGPSSGEGVTGRGLAHEPVGYRVDVVRLPIRQLWREHTRPSRASAASSEHCGRRRGRPSNPGSSSSPRTSPGSKRSQRSVSTSMSGITSTPSMRDRRSSPGWSPHPRQQREDKGEAAGSGARPLGKASATWLGERGDAFRGHVKIAALDPFAGYKTAIDDKLADAKVRVDVGHEPACLRDEVD